MVLPHSFYFHILKRNTVPLLSLFVDIGGISKEVFLRFPVIFNWKNSSSQLDLQSRDTLCDPTYMFALHLILITGRWTLLFSRVCNWEDLWNKHLCKPPESVMQEVTANGIWTLSTYTVGRSRSWEVGVGYVKNSIKKNNNKVIFFHFQVLHKSLPWVPEGR